MSCVNHAFASVHCCLVITCWERADSWLSCVMLNCVFVTFPCGYLGQVWYLIVSIPDPLDNFCSVIEPLSSILQIQIFATLLSLNRKK